MKERINISDLTGDELEKARKGGLAKVVKEKKPEPQAPYGKPQEVRKPEEQKHTDRKGVIK